MKALLITQCADAMMWYADKVGRTVPFLREFPDCFMSREPAGYSNIVKKYDATIIDVADNHEMYRVFDKAA